MFFGEITRGMPFITRNNEKILLMRAKLCIWIVDRYESTQAQDLCLSRGKGDKEYRQQTSRSDEQEYKQRNSSSSPTANSFDQPRDDSVRTDRQTRLGSIRLRWLRPDAK